MPDYLTYYRRTRHPGYIPGVTPYPTLVVPSANLVMWLKPEAIVGLNDGDPISSWPDSSGNGYNATAASTARPLYKTNIINGFAVARFDGSNDELNVTGIGSAIASAAHLFVVARINGNSYNIYNHGNVDSWWKFDANGYIGCFRSARISAYPAGMPTTGSHRFEIQSSASNYEFFLDGTSKGAQAAAYQAGTNHTIGRPDDSNAQKWLNGDIVEILLYSAILGSTDRTALNTYLTTKYAI